MSRRKRRSADQPIRRRRNARSDLAGGVVRYHEWMVSEIPDRISIDPTVCFGKPVIRGTRIWVGLILSMMASGITPEEILREYPQLSDDDLRASLAYGAGLVDAHFVDVA